jgi:putative ABC transport system permease protein
LWNNRSRTVLVILSIAVGVFAIGMINSAQYALNQSLANQYAALRPADVILQTEPKLDDDYITSIRNMRGVADAEGRQKLPLRLSLDGNGEIWRDITLYSIPEFDDQRLFYVRQLRGNWPPKKGEVLIERASLDYLGLQIGDEILVKTPTGRKLTLQVAGDAHDLYRIPPIIEAWMYGYVSKETIRWMGLPDGYNELYIDAVATNEADIRSLTEKVEDRIEGIGLPVYQKTLPDRDEHPLNYIIETVTLLLGLLAVLALLLSGFLVINVISALITQQERQIGIMKAIGARSRQIIGMYFGMVLVLGLTASLIAIPLSRMGANALTSFVAKLINFDAPQVGYNIQALLLQLGVALLVPLLAAAPSIFSGTRVSPARVLSEYGISQVWRGAGIMDFFLKRLPEISRDILLAVRNPFRKRARLILSLFTLTMAGAIFMAVVNLQNSLIVSLDQMLSFWHYDASLMFDEYYPNKRVTNKAEKIPGVSKTESWNFSFGRYVRPDGTESVNLYIMAPHIDTEMLELSIFQGRAISPEDHNAIVVAPALLQNEPDVELGDEITIKIDGREVQYTVVGVMEMMSNETVGYMVYMTYDAYVRHTRKPNRSNGLMFTIEPTDLETQRQITSQVEALFDHSKIKVISNFLVAEERAEIHNAFSIIVTLLMIMTILLAGVGGLGLAGTMSLNVIERTREIGVMRAYGAKNTAVFRIVIIEGILIGMLSWLLAIGFSLPLSEALARTIGLSFLAFPLSATYSISGIGLWALLVIIISIVASFLPALHAVRLTVTQVLAYE